MDKQDALLGGFPSQFFKPVFDKHDMTTIFFLVYLFQYQKSLPIRTDRKGFPANIYEIPFK